MAEQKRYIDREGLRQAFKLIDAKYVAKEEGKGLSTNDFDALFKKKLEEIEAAAQVNKIEIVKVNGEAVEIGEDKSVNIVIPTTAVEDIEAALGFLPLNEEQIDAKLEEAVQEAIEEAKAKRTIVDELPSAEDAQENTIYMVPKNPAEPGNGYTEYMFIDGEFEKIGDTTIDLSDYSTTEETKVFVNQIAKNVAVEEIEKAVEAKELVSKQQVNENVIAATELDIMEAFGLLEGKQAGTIKADGTIETFDSVEEAFAQAVEGDTVTLVEDIEIPADATVAAGVTIDLNGHKVAVKGA